jgi:capsular exopolysaccharide synthesis family protein
VDLGDHFRVIAQNWWRILVASALIAGGVYLLSGRRADVYEASSKLSVTAGNPAAGSDARGQTVFLTETDAERAGTRPVVQKAVRLSGLSIATDEADSRVSASTAADLGFLELTAEGPNPAAARRLVDALAKALIEDVDRQQEQVIDDDLKSVNAEIESLAAQLEALPGESPERDAIQARYEALLASAVDRRTQPRNRVEIVSPAERPSSPSAPKPARDALLALLAALVITGELSVVTHALSDRLPRSQDPEAVGRLLGLPVLAAVPRGSGAANIEAFRILRTNLFALPPSQRPRTIAIVSSNASAGKSFTAINLARSAGAQETRILLIDGDLRRPVVHLRLNLEREPGLTNLIHDPSVRGAVHSVGVGPEFAVGEPRRFLAIPSGHPVRDPVATLSGEALARAVSSLDEAPDLTIVDTPPVALFGDALELAAQCDAAILVLDSKTSRVRTTRATISQLNRAGATILGVVLNRANTSRHGRYAAYS